MPEPQRKDPTLAAILSFLITGAGQIYVGEVGRGVAFLVAGIFCVLLYWLILPVIIGIGVWIWSIVDAHNLAKSFNVRIDTETQQQITREKEQLEQSKKTIKVTDFVENLKKAHKLLINDMYTQQEFINKKDSIITELSSKNIDCSSDDFLAAIVVLKEQKILSTDDISRIKKFIS